MSIIVADIKVAPVDSNVIIGLLFQPWFLIMQFSGLITTVLWKIVKEVTVYYGDLDHAPKAYLIWLCAMVVLWTTIIPLKIVINVLSFHNLFTLKRYPWYVQGWLTGLALIASQFVLAFRVVKSLFASRKTT